MPDAVLLVEEHRSGARDPRTTVAQALERAHALQASCNPFAIIADDAAGKAADALFARLRSGEAPGALAGVPVCVKDILDVEGLPTRWGSPLMAHAPAAKR